MPEVGIYLDQDTYDRMMKALRFVEQLQQSGVLEQIQYSHPRPPQDVMIEVTDVINGDNRYPAKQIFRSGLGDLGSAIWVDGSECLAVSFNDEELVVGKKYGGQIIGTGDGKGIVQVWHVCCDNDAVELGCGTYFNDGEIAVYTPDIKDKGLMVPGEDSDPPAPDTCKLRVYIACGLEYGEEDEFGSTPIQVNPADLAQAPIVVGSGCALTLNYGCGLTVIDGQLVAKPEDLAGEGLDETEEGCGLEVNRDYIKGIIDEYLAENLKCLEVVTAVNCVDGEIVETTRFIVGLFRILQNEPTPCDQTPEDE